MSYRINEIFSSIQGEGGLMGTPAIFIRFAGCNLDCPFCDTNHSAFKDYTIEQLRNELKDRPESLVILTGGEPTLQIDSVLIAFLRGEGYRIALETNGTVFPPWEIDYITLSPKTTPCALEWASCVVDEIRYPIAKGEPIPQPPCLALKYYLSPIFDGNQPIPENIDYAIEMAKQNFPWMVSVQLHKLIGVR